MLLFSSCLNKGSYLLKGCQRLFTVTYNSRAYGQFSDLTQHLHVRPKITVDPEKEDGAVYKIPCECGKVYIGDVGRSMHERIKEHDRDIRLAQIQSSAVTEHSNATGHYPLWDEVKFIDRDPHWYTRRVKEAIHRRLHPDNINRDNGTEIPEA